jgi:hypothetical protein
MSEMDGPEAEAEIDRALAVLELNREGKPLTHEDEEAILDAALVIKARRERDRREARENPPGGRVSYRVERLQDGMWVEIGVPNTESQCIAWCRRGVAYDHPNGNPPHRYVIHARESEPGQWTAVDPVEVQGEWRYVKGRAKKVRK